MTIATRSAGHVTILDLTGPLKIGDAEQSFRACVQELVESGVKNVAVNLAGVPMMDSSGIGAIARSQKLLRERGGTLTFFAAPKMVRQTLRMVGLEKILGLYEDEASALEAT